MLGKLLKYEWKATARIFVPFYLAIVVFALINRIFISLNVSDGWMALVAGLSGATYALAIAATLALTLFIIIQRFYKNLLGDEGYLMFTLPVKTWQNITAKLLIAAAWQLISALVVIGSVFLMVAQLGIMVEIRKAFADIVIELAKINLSLGAMTAWIVAAILVSLFTGILFLYASISIGQLFSRHKLVASFGAFLVLNTVSQIISSLLVGALYLAMPQAFVDNAVPPAEFFTGLLAGTIVLNLLMGVAYYIVSERILTKRLNLE